MDHAFLVQWRTPIQCLVIVLFPLKASLVFYKYEQKDSRFMYVNSDLVFTSSSFIISRFGLCVYVALTFRNLSKRVFTFTYKEKHRHVGTHAHTYTRIYACTNRDTHTGITFIMPLISSPVCFMPSSIYNLL